jgi:hypothetical protein
VSGPIVQNWYNVTSWALRDWRAALKHFDEEYYARNATDAQRSRAVNYIVHARSNYRSRVLSWFWKLCAPIGIGECVPDEVATLLAEEWDLQTREAR